ncbi:TPA: YecR family lipoprotein [Providencia alcalifaciens]|nr:MULTISPECIES: YecR family lipoprotein [Providencia]
MYAVGGSKADGTVEMAYDVGAFETAKVDFNDAQNKATQKCKVWGYKKAEAFGGQKNNCLARNGFGNCMQSQIIVPFQCID